VRDHTLVAVAVDSDVATVEARIEELGGDIRKWLPYDTLRAAVPHESLADLQRTTGVASVEVERDLHLYEGN